MGCGRATWAGGPRPRLRPRALLRDQVDLDSMDGLNLVDALHAKFAIEIPEADYQKLVTLNDLLAYLKGKVG